MEVLFIIGRILFGGFFIYNGINHFRHLKHITGYAQSKKIPLPKVATIVTGLLLLLGGIAVLANFYAVIGLWMLVVFLIPVTVTMHAFWNETDPGQKMMQQNQFAKNVALLGALFLMLS